MNNTFQQTNRIPVRLKPNEEFCVVIHKPDWMTDEEWEEFRLKVLGERDD